jgi:chromosome partitioning protein
MAKVIAFAAAKGGSGSSTVASALAVQAVAEGSRVVILDAEPQRSMTLFWKRRGQPDNPLVKPSLDPVADAAVLRTGACDWVFVDSMHAMVEHIEQAVEAADLVVIVTRISAFDLATTRLVAGACKRFGKRFCFVLNGTDPSWKSGIASARKHLKALGGPVVAKTIRQRVIYARGLMAGKTGPEGADAEEAEAAGDEIKGVWRAIKKIAANRR